MVGVRHVSEPDMGNVLELAIESSYDSLERVTDLVEEAAGKIGITEEDSADLMISVMEAVNNAIQHGNREDAQKKVHIKVQAESSCVTVWIRDEGEGFDLDSVPDPRDPENLLNVSGRGILMMKAFMDQVEYPRDESGRLVKMTKKFEQSPS
jgi:serine/threonine-protein kinase RsbW